MQAWGDLDVSAAAELKRSQAKEEVGLVGQAGHTRAHTHAHTFKALPPEMYSRTREHATLSLSLSLFSLLFCLVSFVSSLLSLLFCLVSFFSPRLFFSRSLMPTTPVLLLLFDFLRTPNFELGFSTQTRLLGGAPGVDACRGGGGRPGQGGHAGEAPRGGRGRRRRGAGSRRKRQPDPRRYRVERFFLKTLAKVKTVFFF